MKNKTQPASAKEKEIIDLKQTLEILELKKEILELKKKIRDLERELSSVQIQSNPMIPGGATIQIPNLNDPNRFYCVNT